METDLGSCGRWRSQDGGPFQPGSDAPSPRLGRAGAVKERFSAETSPRSSNTRVVRFTHAAPRAHHRSRPAARRNSWLSAPAGAYGPDPSGPPGPQWTHLYQVRYGSSKEHGGRLPPPQAQAGGRGIGGDTLSERSCAKHCRPLNSSSGQAQAARIAALRFALECFHRRKGQEGGPTTAPDEAKVGSTNDSSARGKSSP